MEHNEGFKSVVAMIKDIQQRIVECDENYEFLEKQGI